MGKHYNQVLQDVANYPGIIGCGDVDRALELARERDAREAAPAILVLITGETLTITSEDRAKYDALPRWENVTETDVVDIPTGERWIVWREDCGADCFCAAGGERG